MKLRGKKRTKQNLLNSIGNNVDFFSSLTAVALLLFLTLLFSKC